jgi:hypothetical protein
MLPLSWTMTATGLVLSGSGWAGLWAEALVGFHLIPLPLLGAQFFIGLGLGAYDQRCRARRLAAPEGKAGGPAEHRAYREENLLPAHLTN